LRYQLVLLVLPLRIELRTSPLPRECSTTELRQQAFGGRIDRAVRNALKSRRSLPQRFWVRKRRQFSGAVIADWRRRSGPTWPA
jgi:hypothetical protein